MNQNGYGLFRVRATEANGALPVEGAVVRISDYGDGTLLYSLRTDRDGLTPIVRLPAPPGGNSLTPGGAQPYATYNLSVTYEGFYPVEGVGVPVFEGITAVQPIRLIPLTEEENIAGAEDGRVMIYETPDAPSLRPGGSTEAADSNGTISGGVK